VRYDTLTRLVLTGYMAWFSYSPSYHYSSYVYRQPYYYAGYLPSSVFSYTHPYSHIGYYKAYNMQVTIKRCILAISISCHP